LLVFEAPEGFMSWNSSTGKSLLSCGIAETKPVCIGTSVVRFTIIFSSSGAAPGDKELPSKCWRDNFSAAAEAAAVVSSDVAAATAVVLSKKIAFAAVVAGREVAIEVAVAGALAVSVYRSDATTSDVSWEGKEGGDGTA
jgi:hypothetical protein